MKKIYTLIVGLILATLLVACGDTPDVENRIQLSYADWGDQDMNQKLIDAFEEAYPHIDVQLRTDIGGSGAEFTGNLQLAATVGILPDVFATDNVPTIVVSELALDVAEYWDKDEDAELVYPYIADTAVYNGKRYAIPSFQFLKGIMINLTIFEKANLTTVEGKYRIDEDGYPVKDWTYSEFIEIVKAIKSPTFTDPQNTVIALDTWYGSPDFQQVWPTMNNADVMYDTFDGEKFNYTSDEWIFAMQEKVKLQMLTDGTLQNFTQEQYDTYPHLGGYLISTGYGAMDIEGSWQFNVIKTAKDNGVFDLGFWPYPQGSEGLYPPVILDYQAVSSQTKNPEEAYLLAKWMTYGRQGWAARLDVLEERRAAEEADGVIPSYLDRFPIADYPEIWERVEEMVDGIEGVSYIFQHIEKAKPDLDKWLPGYKDFWTWATDVENNAYSWQALVTQGPSAVPQFAVEWNTKANELYNQKKNELGNPNSGS
ncbi:carbohydrate ABC transporter substrate-binding protein [Acholeplasma equirhinis]|uniref:ABC transporter substrate-binding protein n=1 Tax=Acholeplasma equirhinis TaxID=555393 RepID=UPI00197AB5B3|nr:ABC transporter substrate-binding protein [Acholeplasma equirhinis]MBN3490404.1 carbohydrate ABC transporter substrate-binding protein [Acholeplasma equirhinis]